MSTNTIEWNLAFARDEVVTGLEKLLSQLGYTYTRTDGDAETRFQATLSQGVLDIVVQPLVSHRSPFKLQVVRQRTLLTATCTGLSAQEEERFRQALTLTFLRVGG
ncbi:MAG TPA: hypothetical protein VGX03_37975 [Candidatus Binatia bacterium]|nr:hypothetical protein [Candidatus Binatia bacterium]